VRFVVATWVVTNSWWEEHAFLLEATWSATAFLFGAPIAMAVVGRIGQHVTARVVGSPRSRLLGRPVVRPRRSGFGARLVFRLRRATGD
jgi:hypothetical protein